MPKMLCVNPYIICQNRPGGRSGRGNSQDASDVCACPFDVPTRIFAAVLFTFDTGVSGVKYHPLAPKSKSRIFFGQFGGHSHGQSPLPFPGGFVVALVPLGWPLPEAAENSFQGSTLAHSPGFWSLGGGPV